MQCTYAVVTIVSEPPKITGLSYHFSTTCTCYNHHEHVVAQWHNVTAQALALLAVHLHGISSAMHGIVC